MVDGDLVVSARVEVARAGRFHLEGTVHTMGDEPVGWAQTAAELAPDSHWLDLPFYGLMFHDRRVSGIMQNRQDVNRPAADRVEDRVWEAPEWRAADARMDRHEKLRMSLDQREEDIELVA